LRLRQFSWLAEVAHTFPSAPSMGHKRSPMCTSTICGAPLSMKRKLTLTERMARIRKIDTKPELIVRRIAHAIGYRYRLHRRDLPGVPDLVFPTRRKVILVHGCFWHRHACPDGRKLPRSKPEHWAPKLERNAVRDVEHLQELGRLGWDVLVIWECEIREDLGLRRRLIRFLGLPRVPERETTRTRPQRSIRGPQVPRASRG